VEIELPPDLEAALHEESRLSGVSVEKLIATCVRVHFSNTGRMPAPEPLQSPYKKEDFPPGSMAEFLPDYIGVLDSSELGPEAQRFLPLSERTGEKFAEILLEKHRKRHL
jgi:hypothetical protein